MVATRGNAVDDREVPRRVDRHIHEEVQVGDDIALGQAVSGKLEDEILAAGMLIFRRLAETDRVALAGTATRRGVVASAGIGGEARHDPALVGHQPRLAFYHCPGASVADPQRSRQVSTDVVRSPRRERQGFGRQNGIGGIGIDDWTSHSPSCRADQNDQSPATRAAGVPAARRCRTSDRAGGVRADRADARSTEHDIENRSRLIGGCYHSLAHPVRQESSRRVSRSPNRGSGL